ncbi:MAG: chromosomal replication initiator protein DnaA [Aeromicrobium sp.]|uniref:chromosomal replication initiator protein DnaA n=1 Tax=Aeromicrobium sp. TaxID=1871063 RepID=UPI0039E680CF
MPKDAAPLSDSELQAVWRTAVDRLSMGARVWAFPAVPLSFHSGMLIVAVADELTRSQLESRVQPILEQTLSRDLDTEVRLIITIDPNVQLPEPEPERPSAAAPQPEPSPQLWGPARRPEPTSSSTTSEARLNPRYLFENFVTGSSNRFAHAAAVAAAEAPGKAYNPLVIYGDSGLGKTHLLHAIGHYILSVYPSSRVRYVNTEEFTNDVINAISDRKTSEMKRKYREIDVLLVDDIQFFEGKEATQEEFFHTFNALHNENKQIVMTSDRPPKNLKTLEERLRNRFEWGLTTDVTLPELETRIAILRKKADNDDLTVPEDVLEFIASKVQSNIRELEGALLRVTAFANLNQSTIDLNLAQIVLKDIVSATEEPEVTSAVIIAQTAVYSEFSIDEICGANRSRDLVLARQIAMYLCRELTEMSLPKIGQEFGGRDHTTVMHAVKKIGKLMTENHAVFNQVTELTNRIRQQARQA